MGSCTQVPESDIRQHPAHAHIRPADKRESHSGDGGKKILSWDPNSGVAACFPLAPKVCWHFRASLSVAGEKGD